VPAEEAQEEPAPEQSGPTGRRRAVEPGKPTQSLANIADEVRLLDDARRALTEGDTNRALGALDAHAERFQDGALHQEAEVLRIQALLEAGSRDQAEAKAEQYLSAHGDSPHAKRVRGLMRKARSDSEDGESSETRPAP
jgi:outer membrane protein assembly factor BamD (BamD/ComL family)